MNTASSDVLKEDIRDTRQHMDQTLDRLGEQLKPAHLIADLLDMFRTSRDNGGSAQRLTRTATQARKVVAHSIREHPLPSLLIGAGLAWWAYESSHEDETQTHLPGRARGMAEKMKDAAAAGTEQIGEAAATAGEKVQSAMSTAKEKAADVASHISEAAESAWDKTCEASATVSEKTSQLTHAARVRAEQGMHKAKEGLHVAEERFEETIDEYPLAVAGASLAAGLLLGIALPRTRREDRLMGRASDQLFDKAKEKGEALIEQGKNIAAVTAASALDEAEAQGLSPREIVEKAGRVASQIGETAKAAAAEEGLNLSALKEKGQHVAEQAVEAVKQQTRQESEEARRASVA